jgi:hypothetical protein
MARNRLKRNKAAEGVFPTVFAGVLLAATGTSLGYLWLCGRCEDLGRRIKQLEQQKSQIERRVVNEEYKWSNMTSPQNMEKLLQTHRLEMVWPSEKKVVRIQRAPAAEAADAMSSQFAQQGSDVMHD